MDTLLQIDFQPPSTSDYILFVLCILFLYIAAFFSANEVAFFSLTSKEIEEIDESHLKKDAVAMRLISSPQKLLATIIIGSHIFHLAFVVTLVHLLYSLLGDDSLTNRIGLGIGIAAFFVLIFGQIMPKGHASQHAQKTVRGGARMMLFFQNLLYPFVNLLANSKVLVNKRLFKNNHKKMSINELSQALELTDQDEIEEKTMLEGIIRFGNIQVSDIMTSRVDMVDIDIHTDFKKLLNIIIDCGYSRLPVYSETRDNIRGILFSKDLLPYLDKPATFRWQTLIRPPYYVPETKKIDDLLNEFQENRIHLAVVVDEYGGTSGLVTLEDILEEIVGDISDEYDEEQVLFEKIDNHTFVFNAKIALNDFFKVLEVEPTIFAETTEDVETLAGLVLEIKGEMPQEKEQLQYKHFIFEVMEVDKRRIKEVKVYIKNRPNKTSSNDA